MSRDPLVKPLRVEIQRFDDVSNIPCRVTSQRLWKVPDRMGESQLETVQECSLGVRDTLREDAAAISQRLLRLTVTSISENWQSGDLQMHPDLVLASGDRTTVEDGDSITATEQMEQGAGGFSLLVIGSCESMVGGFAAIEMGGHCHIDLEVILIRSSFDDGYIGFLYSICFERVLEMSARRYCFCQQQ